MSEANTRLSELSAEDKRALLASMMQQKASEPVEIPLSFAQQRLWFLDQLVPGSPFYNIPSTIPIPYPVNAELFERALNEIIRRHESLRTTFGVRDGEPVQVIAPSLTIPLPVEDLRHLSSSDRSLEAQRLAFEEAQQPFNLTDGPLIRARLVQKGNADWIFMVTMHHIVSDGWSMGIFFRELTALYGAFSVGRPSPLPNLPIQYADFALWQREWLQGEVLEKQLNYWGTQLADLPTLQLPTDRSRPSVQSHQGAYETLQLPFRLTSSLRQLGRREGATLFMVLLAGFGALLHRYSGQEDIVIGSPIANRNRSEIEGLIGFFVNTQVLRVDYGDEPTFREILGRVREVALEAFAHQDLPFEMLVERLQPDRDLSRNPLFQVTFQLLNTPGMTESGSQSQNSAPVATRGTSIFDLAFTLVEQAGALIGGIEYSTDLFDAETIQRLAAHYHRLLETAVAAPDKPIWSLPLLTAPEREEILVEWNATETDYPRESTLGHLFEEQVASTPDAIALIYGEETITYQVLNERANHLAHSLREEGVTAGSLVGLCMERSAAMVVGLLGILKAGGAYLPLDVSYPKERLQFMIEDTGVELVLTQLNPDGVLGELDVRVLPLMEGGELESASETHNSKWTENPSIIVGPEDLAYVIYTSGSTGTPKGAGIPHRAVVRLVQETDYVRFESEETFAQLAPISFDASTFEIWGPLLNGARLAILPKGPLSLNELGKALQKMEVTTLWLTSGLFNQMIEARPDALRGLTQLLTGGDVLSVPHVREALNLLPNCVLINGYGPTENTTFTCCFTIDESSLSEKGIPIGRPINNTRVYVVDSHNQPVPIGVPGELLIGGDGLARGYLHREDLTAERFIPDPFSNTSDARLYRTGDLVRWRADGVLEFIGRLDHQVKVRGYRIELGEIEAALLKHPTIREAVVITREDVPGDKRIAAYVVPEAESDVHSEAIRGFLQGKLPGFMIPNSFISLKELPLGPNGKVDRRSLTTLAPLQPETESTYVAPQTDVEHVLANIWADILDVKRVGLYDNFFTVLGGHSLLATQLVSHIREVFQVDLPLRGLFETPTVAGVTDLLLQSPEQRKKVETIAKVLHSLEP